jgi:hypothetical protein
MTTADTLTATGTNGEARQSATTSAADYTFAVWIKRKTGSGDVRIGNFTTGTSVVAVTSEWQLFTSTATLTAASHNFTVRCSTSGDEVYVWGAHLYRSDLGGMVDNPDQPLSRASYVPTTSSAKYLPRIGHHVYNGSAWVNEGLLAESEARTNLLPYSNAFATAPWIAIGSVTVSGGIVGPDGENSAYEINCAAANAYIRTTLTGVMTAGGSDTQSIWVKKKAGGATHIRLTSNNTAAWSTGLSTKIELTDQWTQVHQSGALSNTTSANIIFGNVDENNAGDPDCVGASYIAFAQVEAGSTPSSLIPTSGASVTRPSETFTIPSANLPWPSPVYTGDNVITNGTFDTDSDWTKASNWSIGSGVATSDGGSGLLQQTTTVLDTSKVYLFEFEITSYTSGGVKIYSGAGGDPTDYVSAVGSYSYAFSPLGTTPSLFSNAFNGSVDNISVREINPLSVSIAMDGRMTYADEGSFVEVVPFRWRADASNRITTELSTFGSQGGQFLFAQTSGGTNDNVQSATDHYSPDVLVPFDIASRHGSTFINGAVEGVALTEDTTPTALPDLSATDFLLAYDFNGTIGTFRVWDKDLGDTGIVEATNPSLEPSLSLTFEGTGTNSFVVNNWSN